MSADSLQTMESVQSFLDHGGYVWNVGEIRLSDEQQQQAMTEAGADITLEFPVDELPLWNPADWGAYGVDVRVFQPSAEPRAGMGITRGLMFWYDGEQAEGRADINALLSNAWQAKEEDWSKLSRDGVTLALQPDQAEAYSLTIEAQESEVLLLPSRASDISMLAATGQRQLLDLALASREIDPTQDRASWIRDAVVTSEDWLSSATLEATAGNTVLSPPSGFPGSFDWSTSERYSTDPESGDPDHVLLGSFGRLSQMFSSPDFEQYPPFYRDQLIRALTATAVKDGQDEASRLWVNLGSISRPEDLSTEQMTARLSALLDAPWVNPVSLRSILDGGDFGQAYGSVPELPTSDTTTVATALDPVSRAVKLALAVIGSEPSNAGEIAALEQAALAPTTFGMSLEQRQELADSSKEAIMTKYDVVEIVPSQSVNIMGPSAPFPVTVTNKGSSPIDLQIGIVPSNQLIRADEWVPVTVPAGSTSTINVPVRAVGSGSVSVIIEARTDEGTVLASSPAVSVRSRPGVGDAITWVVGTGLGALFLLGLIRTIHRGRRGGVGPTSSPTPTTQSEVTE